MAPTIITRRASPRRAASELGSTEVIARPVVSVDTPSWRAICGVMATASIPEPIAEDESIAEEFRKGWDAFGGAVFGVRFHQHGLLWRKLQ